MNYGTGSAFGGTPFCSTFGGFGSSPQFPKSHPQTSATNEKLEPGITSTTRDAPPTHYTFKIQSFSLLSKASVDRYDSDIFEAGGYKWKLSLYPNGNKIRNGKDHISLYLALVDTSSLPPGWEVNVIFSFFVFDQFQDKYLTFQDGKVRRFHAVKTEWGIAKFIDLDTFKKPSNGYLVKDTCVFGAEVFVIKSAGQGECLSMIEGPVTCNHTWTIERFPVESLEYFSGQQFIAGDYEWRMKLYYNGMGDGEGNSVSLFLSLYDHANPLPPDTKLYVNFSLSIMEQISGKPFKKQESHLFSALSPDWGWQKFMPLGKFNDPTKGFRRNNTCIIVAQVTVLGLVTKLS